MAADLGNFMQAENFRQLCTGEGGKTVDGSKDLTYKVRLPGARSRRHFPCD